MAVLDIRDLKVYYKTSKGFARAVDGVSLDIEEGEYLGLVGESGCGKSTIAKAILRVLPSNAQILGGQIFYGGRDLTALTSRDMKKIQWKEIAMVPQSAMNAFDPVYRIEDQMLEAIEAHGQVEKPRMQARVEELFHLVGMNTNRLKDFPHQFSGGMRQRAMIAMALVLDPRVIVADEPTTGLDVIVQDQILYRIAEIHKKMHKSMLLITHNIAIVSENCQKIAVMYAGKIMEYGRKGVFLTPYHPYTLGLINAFPDLDEVSRELISIPGAPPSLLKALQGCRFYERCPFALERCAQEEPLLRLVADQHLAACHYPEDVERFRRLAMQPETWVKREVKVQ